MDIAIIAVFLYSALSWFRETASRGIVVGVTAMIFLYFAAVTFNLYLTSQLLHAVFAIVLIMLVVMFQDDLRRGFERLAAMGTWRRQRQAMPPPSEMDTLVEVAFGLAERRVGALMIVKGNDDATGTFTAAYRCPRRSASHYWKASSIHTPRVMTARSSFAVESWISLPPICRFPRIASRSVRVEPDTPRPWGISERCDVLAIAVSEERGLVSIAENGRILTVSSPADLKDRMEKFTAARFPVLAESVWKLFVSRHRRLKVIGSGCP